MYALRSLRADEIKLWLTPNQSLVIVCTQATLYEALTEYQNSANCLKDEHRGHKLARQSEAKRKQAPQSEANVCRRRRQMQSRKNLPYRTPNNAQNTQHKLGVAFSYLERNNMASPSYTHRSVLTGLIPKPLLSILFL